jgi:hypothetical protein
MIARIRVRRRRKKRREAVMCVGPYPRVANETKMVEGVVTSLKEERERLETDRNNTIH